ncbi:MAG: TonB-dependent receptor, partial [Bdellovibrio sp.]
MIQARFLVVVVVFIYSSLSLAENVSELGAVKVIGSSEAELVQPNSAHFISKEQLEQQQQSDVTRILKQVPGVYVQEEDGFGLRPNIGLRGTHPHRSRKVVILEDGILIGPAPYSAPAAYYTPFMSKIESLEVFKGVASVSYGPNSIGGAINYLTRSLPAKDNVELELAGGSYNTQKYRALVSTVWEQGRLLLEGTRLQTDGYKKLDTGRDTGFAKNDFLLKGEQRLPGDKPQALEWKVGYATELSDETYLGLSLNDFDTSPYRRYAASENDLMDWQHQQYQLSYKLQALENWGVWTTLYHHKFHRDWSRLNNFRNTAISISDVLKNPTAGANQLYYDILTGAEDSSSVGTGGDLVIVQNNRYFISQGIQLGSFSSHTVNDWTHNVTLGARLHEDEIRRYHTEETHSMVGGHLERTADARTYTAVNKDKSHVITLTAVDEIHWNALKITLASRFENIRYNTDNDLTGASSARSENIFVPGAGVLYQFNDSWTGLVGVNRGYTVSGPSAGDSEKPEESINYEAGLRFTQGAQRV